MKNLSINNIKLNHQDSFFYGNVDGLSLQNLFYANHGEFPSCYVFDINQRTRADWTFNVTKIIDRLKSTSMFGNFAKQYQHG